MSAKKKEIINSKHSVLNNFGFMVKSIKKLDKALLYYMPLPMVVQIGISVLGIYIPKIIIDLLVS